MSNEQQNPEDIFAELMGEDVNPAKPDEPEKPQEQEPVAEHAGSNDPPDEAAPAQDEQPLTDEVRQKLAQLKEMEENYAKLQRDYQAVHGRLAPMQRKIAEMEQAARASSVATSKPPQGASNSTDDQSLDDEMRAVEEDYPDLAKAFKKRIAQLESKLEQMGQKFEPVVRRIGHQEEVDRLTNAHADWREINASPDFRQFLASWWEMQPEHAKNAIGGVQGYMQALNSADFTIPLVSQFKALRQPPPAQRQAPAPEQQPATRAQPNAQSVRRAMSAAPTVRTSGMPPAVDLSALPEEEQFELLWKQAGTR